MLCEEHSSRSTIVCCCHLLSPRPAYVRSVSKRINDSRLRPETALKDLAEDAQTLQDCIDSRDKLNVMFNCINITYPPILDMMGTPS